VSAYCRGCGTQHDEDDDRLCSRCAPAADAVERAAAAIYHADYFGGDTMPTLDFRKDAPFEAMAETTKAEYRLLARAALLAANRAAPATTDAVREVVAEETARCAAVVQGMAMDAERDGNEAIGRALRLAASKVRRTGTAHEAERLVREAARAALSRLDAKGAS
jgi:hypothetical protein